MVIRRSGDVRLAAVRCRDLVGGDLARDLPQAAARGVRGSDSLDLRHRRISLLHLGGVPWARIGEHVGQRNPAVTANGYSHVPAEVELDDAELLK